MSWNNRNLEKRASVDNQNYSDRMQAQSEINWQKRQDQITELQNQGHDLNPRNSSLFKGLGGYIGLIFVFGVTATILFDPTQLSLASPELEEVTGTTSSSLSLWAAIGSVIFIMLFISLSMINRGREKFLTKIRKRFTFCLVTSILITVLLAIRLSFV